MNIFINLPWLLNSTSKIQFFHLFRTKIVFNEKKSKMLKIIFSFHGNVLKI